MLVTYPVFTQSVADAIYMAQNQAKANGYKITYLVKANKVGNGAWEVTLRLGTS